MFLSYEVDDDLEEGFDDLSFHGSVGWEVVALLEVVSSLVIPLLQGCLAAF